MILALRSLLWRSSGPRPTPARAKFVSVDLFTKIEFVAFAPATKIAVQSFDVLTQVAPEVEL